MSVFTSRITVEVEIPHDPGSKVTLRKLAPRHLEAAAKEAQRVAMAEFKDMGGAAFMKELAELGGNQAAREQAAADPVGSFDRLTLLQKGIVSWSYDAPLDAETLADLDDETQAFLAREVLKLAKPALFQSDADAEAARKNG